MAAEDRSEELKTGIEVRAFEMLGLGRKGGRD